MPTVSLGRRRAFALDPKLVKANAQWLDRVRQDGMSLKATPWYVKLDRDIVLEAVHNDGLALHHAGES